MSCDLHCHTKISDGSLGIEELIGVAKRRGLTAIGITDHDSTAGASRGVIIGKRQDFQVIHGVELSTYDTQRGRKAHLLCYLADAPGRLEGICCRNIESRKAAAVQMMRKLLRYYPITPELVARCATGSLSVYKQHIMHALMDAGYTDSIFGPLYDKLFDPEEGIVLVEPEYPDTREVLQLIHSAGGIAVLAHPYTYHSEALLEELVTLGLDGVEVYHPHHSQQQIDALLDFASAHNLLITGGSDFHGMYSRDIRPMGSVTVEDSVLQAMLQYKAVRKPQTL